MSHFPRLARWSASAALVLAFAAGCAPAPAPPRVTAAFRPAPGRADLWLATPIAIEVENEHDARAIEAADCDYIGEIDIRGAAVKRGDMALVAAQYGATHYRSIVTPEAERTSIILYRIARDRWSWLPDELRPAPPAL